MEILYHDDRVAVCVKPAGVLSTDEPGGVPELLRRALGMDDTRIRSVHRLDRAVGGVMVYAVTRRAASDLGGQIQAGRFQKEYLAAAHGRPAEDRGAMEDYLYRDRRERKTYIAGPETPEARRAVLRYTLLEYKEGLSLLSVELQTGRTHQIRCQLSGRGLPLAGDKKYGAGDECPVALWSHRLAFDHPRTGERMEFSQPPPDAFPWSLFALT